MEPQRSTDSASPQATAPTFEATYPVHEFAPLVAMVLALGGWLADLQRDRVMQAPRTLAKASDTPAPKAHAT